MHLSYVYTTSRVTINTDYLTRFFQVGIFIALFLVLLYAVERNSVLSAEREIKQKQTRITSSEEDLSRLKIKAAQLESSQSIKSAALAENMVPAERIRFVSVDDAAISMK